MSDVAVNPSSSSDLYGEAYYRNCCSLTGDIAYERSSHWLEFFGGVANRIVRDLQPSSAMDAGCAIGLLVEQLELRGVDAFGVDISKYAIGEVPERLAARCKVQTLLESLGGPFDLVTCIEVIEHLPAGEVGAALDNLCAATDTILFSSTPFDYGEATHFSVQPAEFWAEQFAMRGFYRDLTYDASYLTSWAGLYRRRSPRTSDLVNDYERLTMRLRTENAELRSAVVSLQSKCDQLALGELGPNKELRAQLIATQAELLVCRDQVVGLEARVGVVHAERDQFQSLAASREAAVRELDAMHASRVWRAIGVVLAPYRKFRARR